MHKQSLLVVTQLVVFNKLIHTTNLLYKSHSYSINLENIFSFAQISQTGKMCN